MGPKKDIVGLFRQAAQKQGLKFAVSEHLAWSYVWWTVSHGSDKTGPLAGVPYDGADPQYADLYHDYPKEFLVPEQNNQPTRLPAPLAWRQHYFTRLKDLIDKYQPDLLYNDGGMVFPEVHYRLVSHLYNVNAKLHGGKVEAVYTSKGRNDSAIGTCVFDIERGVADNILANPWQTDTCIGNWHYDQKVYQGNSYKTPKRVVDMLVDIVSRNGNLMLNFPLPNSGALDDKELKILSGITAWMDVNSEGIHASRPWKIFGDGPGTKPAAAADLRFNESKLQDLTAEDVRFTTKGDTLYAFVMGWPGKEAVIPSLATTAKQGVGKIQNVELLGAGKVPFTQDETALKVRLPEKQPCEYAIALKINGA
jgi:alpha-L-fucosidase